MLGLGRNRVHRVAADEQGRMRPDALRETLAGLRDRPVIVCAQSGNVNTGAFDPLPEIVAAVRELPNAWLHVDGAFGLWAARPPSLRHLAAGLADADSWTTDAHKWLNVPYDSGIAIVRDAAAHHAAMTLGAAYYVETAGGERDPYNWVAESSRRARGFPIYAALRSLGRDGLADDDRPLLRDRPADGRRPPRRARASTILNDVVLNQVLVRFAPPVGDGADEAAIDAFTRDVIAAVQADGTCWLGGTTWHGMAAMRISVSNWSHDRGRRRRVGRGDPALRRSRRRRRGSGQRLTERPRATSSGADGVAVIARLGGPRGAGRRPSARLTMRFKRSTADAFGSAGASGSASGRRSVPGTPPHAADRTPPRCTRPAISRSRRRSPCGARPAAPDGQARGRGRSGQEPGFQPVSSASVASRTGSRIVIDRDPVATIPSSRRLRSSRTTTSRTEPTASASCCWVIRATGGLPRPARRRDVEELATDPLADRREGAARDLAHELDHPLGQLVEEDVRDGKLLAGDPPDDVRT